MSISMKIVPLAAVLALAACTTMPSGPSAMVLPGTGKSFDAFRADDFECKQFAQMQLEGSSAASAQAESGAKSALVGTLLGAVAGAAINGRQGAAVGAGTGLVFGGLSGAASGQHSGNTMQQRYDNAYQQCMYAKGHRVPMAGGYAAAETRQAGNSYVQPPPPPPGTPPAPPPR